MIDPDTPEILRQFLAYHETIKGQSPKTIDEYHLDLRMFLRFLVLMRSICVKRSFIVCKYAFATGLSPHG